MDEPARDERSGLGAFASLVAIRTGFWILAALSLLWVPLRHDLPPFRALEARSDLVFGTFEQWDAGWFLRIAEHGYDIRETTAFFPVYPLALRLLGSNVVTATLLSLVAAGIAAVLVAKIARPVVGPRGAGDAVLYLALCPVAFVFTAAYSEGLFLAFATGSFYAATRNRSWLAGVLGALAVGTRLVGLALVPALLYLLWPRERRGRRDLVRPAPVLLLPAALGVYMLYLRHRFGSAFVFQDVQGTVWDRHTATLGPLGGVWDSVSAGAHGSAELIRHLPRALGAPGGFPQRDVFATWNVVHLLVLAAALWLTWVAWRRLGPALGLYAVTLQIMLLSATVDVFPLASYPRYLVADFPLFIALALVTRDRPRVREAILVGFAATGALAAAAFAHHVWIV